MARSSSTTRPACYDHLSAGVYEIDPLEYDDDERLRALLTRFVDETGSPRRDVDPRGLARRNACTSCASRPRSTSACATRCAVGKTTGFLEYPRQGPRPTGAVRLRDWREVYEPQSDDEVSIQGARCMDCGIPFCMQGCPLGNRIPTFNDHVYRSHWEEAAEQLFDTNNFPEFTGRLCPAPCESACVLGISDSPVTIERIEYEVVEHAFAHGYRVADVASTSTGQRVAVVGSGPAGLACAAQLASVGHEVHVFERSDAIGGLLRYGIPEFKLEKAILERRLAVMAASGVTFHTERATWASPTRRSRTSSATSTPSSSRSVRRGRD